MSKSSCRVDLNEFEVYAVAVGVDSLTAQGMTMSRQTTVVSRPHHIQVSNFCECHLVIEALRETN